MPHVPAPGGMVGSLGIIDPSAAIAAGSSISAHGSASNTRSRTKANRKAQPMRCLRNRPRNLELQPEFWHERWRVGQIGFHQSAVDQNLRDHWPALGLTGGSRAFVPLCGKSLDLLWLREQGHSVAGVELSAVALESFCLEHGIPARRRTLDHFDVYEAANLQLYCGDFFALTAPTARPGFRRCTTGPRSSRGHRSCGLTTSLISAR